MANIQERKSKDGKLHYRVQIRLKGYPTQTATFDRRTDAKEWVQQVESDLKAGRYLKTAEAKRHTFGNMIDRYLRDVLPAKSLSSQNCQTTQLNWWKERIGRVVLADVTPTMIVDLRDELSSGITVQGKARSPSTVVRYMAALSHCFTVAVNEWGWLDDSPMRKVSRPKQAPGRTRFLSDEERIRLLEACRKSDSPYLYSVVVVALSTGMRRGEILGLTWDRVDLARGLILLLPENTKTREARGVPLVGRA